MSPTAGSSAEIVAAMACFVDGAGSKLKPASASSRRSRSEAETGAPFRNAPSPEIALKVSCSAGSCTTATARSSSAGPSCNAMDTDHGPEAER